MRRFLVKKKINDAKSGHGANTNHKE